jgi:hypothetical protein
MMRSTWLSCTLSAAVVTALCWQSAVAAGPGATDRPDLSAVPDGPLAAAGGQLAQKDGADRGGLFSRREAAVSVIEAPDALLPLFLAVFPQADAAAMVAVDEIGGTRYQASPVLAFATPERIVLIVSETDPIGMHAAAGGHSAYYLQPAGAGYDLAGSDRLFDVSGGWGVPGEAAAIEIVPGLPGLTVSSGYTNQGVTCGGLVVYTFGDAGPQASSTIPIAYSDEGSIGVMNGDVPTAISGAVLSIDAAGAMTVRYTGTVGWTEPRGPFAPGPVDLTVTIPLTTDQSALWEAYPLQC